MIFLRSKRLEKKASDAREPSLYRSICTSIISTLLSLVMLVGTTFAWFTDNLTTGVFTITAGSLAAQASYCTELPDGGSSSVDPMWLRLNPGNTFMFGGMTFTPGTSQTAYLKLENKNDNSNNVAAVKYMFSFEDVAASPVALTVEEGVTTQSLSDALTFTCKTASSIGDLTNAGAETRTLSAFTSTEGEQTGPFEVTVEQGQTVYVALTIGMNTDGSASITPSSIQLRLKIIVTNAGEGSEENIISQLNELTTPSEPVGVPVVTEIENEETSTTEPPTAGTPTAGTPTAGTPTAGTPTEGTPTEGTPTEGTPTTGTPTTEPPTTEPPTTGTPTTGTPTEGTPTEGTPTAGTPATGTSTTETPATGTPTTETPATGMPTMEMPTEETPET